ncbi:MAG: hypothetical protein IBX48_10340 [Thiomicrospira sp.]|nr:hypothetical protein [Thiomicrospira sp.]MBE0494719.1 hypothetical protein [Thiomicrospira sp.]
MLHNPFFVPVVGFEGLSYSFRVNHQAWWFNFDWLEMGWQGFYIICIH